MEGEELGEAVEREASPLEDCVHDLVQVKLLVSAKKLRGEDKQMGREEGERLQDGEFDEVGAPGESRQAACTPPRCPLIPTWR